MDRRLLGKAQSAVAGQGDGRISKADAQEMIRMVKDGHVYTQIEKDTMETHSRSIFLDRQCQSVV